MFVHVNGNKRGHDLLGQLRPLGLAPMMMVLVLRGTAMETFLSAWPKPVGEAARGISRRRWMGTLWMSDSSRLVQERPLSKPAPQNIVGAERFHDSLQQRAAAEDFQREFSSLSRVS